MGEEFPGVHAFLDRAAAGERHGVVVHALLDSPSTTGAYRFAITPGTETVMDVDVTLFPRVALDNVGIAPLTSMFLFDESERTRIDDFRDEVHDSDGLQIMHGLGRAHVAAAAQSHAAAGVELHIARRRARSVWSSARAACPTITISKRATSCGPSTWIEPTSQWGAGAVQLVEIPTDNETNDNIVAFWRPNDPIPAGKPWHASYRLRWTDAAAS